MGKEIERKFLLKNDEWRKSILSSSEIKQGYFPANKLYSERIRLVDGKAFLTIKSGSGLIRNEYEFEVPFAEGEAMLKEFCANRLIEKTRYTLQFSGKIWIVDEYHGANSELQTAEIELDSAEDICNLPDWLGQEVTGDKKLSNEYLATHPSKKITVKILKGWSDAKTKDLYRIGVEASNAATLRAFSHGGKITFLENGAIFSEDSDGNVIRLGETGDLP